MGGKSTVGDVNLKEQWDKRRKEAERLLQNFYGHPFNFETKFQNSNYDLLKPMGSYVGVSATADDACSEEERGTPVCPPSVLESLQAQPINVEHTESPVSAFYLILYPSYLFLDCTECRAT